MWRIGIGILNMQTFHYAVGLKRNACCLGKENISRTEYSTLHREEVNCAPQSEMILAGTPKREIQPELRARAES